MTVLIATNRFCAIASLEQSLTLAEPEGYIRLFADEGPPMAELLHQTAARGIGGPSSAV